MKNYRIVMVLLGLLLIGSLVQRMRGSAGSCTGS